MWKFEIRLPNRSTWTTSPVQARREVCRGTSAAGRRASSMTGPNCAAGGSGRQVGGDRREDIPAMEGLAGDFGPERAGSELTDNATLALEYDSKDAVIRADKELPGSFQQDRPARAADARIN